MTSSMMLTILQIACPIYAVGLVLLLLFETAYRPQRGRVFRHVVLVLLSLHLGLNQTDVDASSFWMRLLTGALYVSAFWAALGLLEGRLFDRHKHERVPRFPMFFRDILRFLATCMVFLILLKVVFRVEPSALVVTSTVMSAIIGLALQDMLGNVVAGVAIQVERPFQEGHWVKVGERNGKVLQMSWRSTQLLTRDGDVLFIPNATLAKGEILNYYQPQRPHLVRRLIGTSYSDPPEKVKEVLLGSLTETPGVLSNPPVSVHLANYLDFSISYELRFWIGDYQDEPQIIDRVYSRLWYVFRREGITIPFPINEVHHKSIARSNQKQGQLRDAAEAQAVRLMSEVDLFRGLGLDKLASLVQAAQFQHYCEGEYLVRQGATDANLFLIERGSVTVSVVDGHQGLERTVGSFTTGYCFGEYALLTGEPRSASVIAEGHVEAMVLSKDAVEPLLRDSPELVVTLSAVLNRRHEELHLLMTAEAPSLPEVEANRTLLTRIQRFFNL